MVKKYSRFILFCFAAILFLASCASSQNAASLHTETPLVQNPEIVSGKLDNGMDYYILRNDVPYNRMSLRLVVKVGSLAEEDNQKGVAHLIEHMAFNGTEHFEKNSIIDYAESIGMAFGPEVNAYTSFEETVYMLEIPADKGEYLEQAMLIFKDWASAVTFDQEELDKERGVVTEEWRGNLGLSGRLTNAVLPFELEGSRYVDRLPIGDMDVIHNITRDEVISFYKKWYRPENMAVVITGMVDPQVAEYLIKETVGTIPSSGKGEEPPKGSVPARTEKDVLVFKDAEMPYVQVQILSLDDNNEPITTEEALKESYLNDLAASVLSARLSEITQTAEAPWLLGDAVQYMETNSAKFHGTMFIPKDDMFKESFQRILDELSRLLLHGITQSEFERTTAAFLMEAEQNAELHPSTQALAQELCNYVIRGDTVVSAADYLDAVRRILSSITLEEANTHAKKLFGDKGTICMIYAPENAELPEKDEILYLWENYTSEIELTAYEDEVAENGIMDKPQEKATVVSTRYLDTLKTNEYVLSNGVRILIKKTDFDKSKVSMTAVSQGGASLVSDEDYPSCVLAPIYSFYSGVQGMNISQLQKYMSGKYIGFDISIDEHEETISSEATVQNIEDMLQLVNRFMVEPQFTDEGWNYTCLMAEQQAKMYNMQPSDVLLSKMKQILYGDSIRHTSINPEFVAMLDREKCEKIYRERFGNAADFTFTFVGDIDEEALVELCCYYLGTLPGNPDETEAGKYEYFPFPAGITKDTVKKGQENKGQVFMAFGGTLPAAKDVYEIRKDSDMIEQLRALTEIKLREIIREDKSGTYGVSVAAVIDGYPERFYKFQISFGCEPAREKELEQEVIAALNSLRSELVDNSYIEKLHEAFRRNLEVNNRNNAWWVNMINAVEVLKYLPAEVVYDDSSIRQWTTAESMRDLAEKYLKTDNYVCVYLEPEA